MLTDTPALFGVAAIAIAVLGQVPLVAYLSRYVALDADADRPDPQDGYVTYGTTDARPDLNAVGTTPGETDHATCPHCRAPVALDTGYEYCGECAGKLPHRMRQR